MHLISSVILYSITWKNLSDYVYWIWLFTILFTNIEIFKYITNLRKVFLKIVGQYVGAHELLQKVSQCFTVCVFVEGSSTICQTTILYSLVI